MLDTLFDSCPSRIMTTHDKILALKPKSIFDVIPEAVFIERDHPDHPYIRSGNYYEIKYAIATWLQPRRVLEIGVRYGYSLATFIMASHRISYAEGWDNCCYDPQSNIKADAVLRSLPKKCDFVLRTLECEEVDAIAEPFDLVHIDGPHFLAATLHCLNLCKGKAKAVLMDDYFNCPCDAEACHMFGRENAALVREKVVLNSERGECLMLLENHQ